MNSITVTIDLILKTSFKENKFNKNNIYSKTVKFTGYDLLLSV